MLSAVLVRNARRNLLRWAYHVNALNKANMTSQMDEPQWKYYQKNWAKDRPTSPWTVYKPQITSGMSLLHRITGMVVYGGLSFVTFGLMILPHDFLYYIHWIQDLAIHPHVVNTIKFLICLPLMYHTLNGIRHLAWDFGKGYDLPTVYKTGYLVIILTVIGSFVIAYKL